MTITVNFLQKVYPHLLCYNNVAVGNYHIISHDISLRISHLILCYLIVRMLSKIIIPRSTKLTQKNYLSSYHVGNACKINYLIIQKINSQKLSHVGNQG